MEKNNLIASGAFKVEERHREVQKWISSLHFTMDEVIFIEKLLNSYVFEPNTPNLFERLQDYKGRLDMTKGKINEVEKLLIGYEAQLVGLLECEKPHKGSDIESKFRQMESVTRATQDKFRMLKTEIFNYAGGILKQRDN